MILGLGHKPQQWARKQTYSHATVKTKGRCWHAERLWIIPSRGSPLPLSTFRSLYTLLCVPLGIQIVQIVCECELSTVFNFGSPQCLVSASLRRAVPHATVPAKAETAMHFDRTDRWRGRWRSSIIIMCTVRASRASGKSTGSQITRPSHSRPGMSRKCDESTLLHHQARTGTDLDRAGVLLACPAAMQMPKMRMHSLSLPAAV